LIIFRCSVHVGPAEPKGKPNDSQFKRSKPGKQNNNQDKGTYRIDENGRESSFSLCEISLSLPTSASVLGSRIFHIDYRLR
jgi:hypothetical protein